MSLARSRAYSLEGSPALGYRCFDTVNRTIQGVETVNMIRKGQVKRLDSKDAIGQAKFIECLFGIAA